MKTSTRLRGAVAVGAAVVLSAGCAATGQAPSDASPSPPGPTATELAPMPLGIHWVRTAAEHRMVYEQTYRWAGERVEGVVSRGGAPDPWAVILDADETVLDNSLYQARRARAGLGYTPESWNDWVREETAGAMPGALTFMAVVKRLGGHVAIVTNRDDSVCDATRRNLAALGAPVDVVLCRRGASEKETRFRAVQEGTTPVGLPPLHVVAWVGDNIHDFPGGVQSLREAPAGEVQDFGTRFFVLPNPMYGSWTSNPGG